MTTNQKQGNERGSRAWHLVIALPMVFSTSIGAAEFRKQFGSIEVRVIDSKELRIRQGTLEWRVDLSNLALGPCPDCFRDAGVFAWDERHKRLYFGITTGESWDKPTTIYGYSLTTHRTTPFITTWASAIGLFTISPSGRYVAYFKGHHASPAAGCRSQTDIEVLDLWNRKVGNPELKFPDSAACVFIEKLDWSSSSVPRYEASDIPNEAIAGQIDVWSLAFR